MTTEYHERSLEASPLLDTPAHAKLSWREKRYRRRRRRIWFEEILGWILVPILLVGTYWLLDLVLNALGTSPAAIMHGIDAVGGQR